VATKKTASTKVSKTVQEYEAEFDGKKDNRKEPLKQGSQLLKKQKEGTARTLVTTPVLTNRPVNVYIERVVDHTTGEEGLWLWHTTEQSDMVGKVKLVEVNNSTLQEIYQGDEWSIEYTKKAAEELAAQSFGKTSFNFKDGLGRVIITREEFLDYTPKQP